MTKEVKPFLTDITPLRLISSSMAAEQAKPSISTLEPSTPK